MDPAEAFWPEPPRRADGSSTSARVIGGTVPLSEHEQRVVAELDADVATTVAGRTAARLRAHHSAAGLYLTTLALVAIDTGVLFLGADVDSVRVILLGLVLFCVAPVPTVIANRYRPAWDVGRTAAARGNRPGDRPH